MDRVIVKFNKDGSIPEIFSSLKPFFEKYPLWDTKKIHNKINNCMSRNKQNFASDNGEFVLIRAEIIKSDKQAKINQTNKAKRAVDTVVESVKNKIK